MKMKRKGNFSREGKKPKLLDRPLDMNNAQTAEEIMKFGIDRISKELSNRGLKCGGGLPERAARLAAASGSHETQVAALRGKNLSTAAKRCRDTIQNALDRQPRPDVIDGHLVWTDAVSRQVFRGLHLDKSGQPIVIGTLTKDGALSLTTDAGPEPHEKKPDPSPVAAADEEGGGDFASIVHPFDADENDHWYDA